MSVVVFGGNGFVGSNVLKARAPSDSNSQLLWATTLNYAPRAGGLFGRLTDWTE